MKQSTEKLIGRIGETFQENIKEYFHWIFVIAPVISISLARGLGQDEKLIDIILIIATIFFNFFLLWLWSYYEYYKTKELQLFKTFFLNILPPIKSGGELLINTEIAIIEDKNTAYYHGKLEKKFKSDPVKDDPKRIPIKDKDLTFREVFCESFNKDGLDDDAIRQKEEDFKRSLINNLSQSKAVVVVRTPELEEKTWVYDAVESWANSNSDSPCLFIRKKDQIYAKHPIADNYLWIYDDPKLLPWKLLQRAKDRSSAWRSQASFNRAMVTNIFYLFIMVIVIATFIISNLEHDVETKQEKITPFFESLRAKNYKPLEELNSEDDTFQNDSTNNADDKTRTEKMNRILNDIKSNWQAIAKETRDEYKISYTNLMKSENLEVSYWFRYQDKAQAFLTTEWHPEIDNFPVNEGSAIGCAFSHPNHIARWEIPKNLLERLITNRNKTSVINFKGEEESSLKCATVDRTAKPIQAIACVSYNHYPDLNFKHTVGICVFSGSANANIFINDYAKYLEERAREFDQYIDPLLEKDRVTALLPNKENKISPIIANE